MKRAAVLTAALLLLAGCGGGGGSSYPDAQHVADAAGWSNCETTDSLAADAVYCDQGTVDWFTSGDKRDGWLKIADAMPVDGIALVGSDWVLECDNKKVCDEAKAEVGGKLH